MQHQLYVLGVAFGPDGKFVATGSADGAARLWDAATGQPVGAPMRHQGGVVALAFGPDGKAIVTGSDDGTARLWGVPNLEADAERILLGVGVITGEVLDSSGTFHGMEPASWHRLRRRLAGLDRPPGATATPTARRPGQSP